MTTEELKEEDKKFGDWWRSNSETWKYIYNEYRMYFRGGYIARMREEISEQQCTHCKPGSWFPVRWKRCPFCGGKLNLDNKGYVEAK